MKHRKKQVILDRKAAPRKALLLSLATSLVLFEKVKTTEAKAKAIKPLADKLITLAKKKTLVSKRELNALMLDKKAVKKLIEVYVPRFADRTSGYTRVVKLGVRKGDGATVAQIEYLQ